MFINGSLRIVNNDKLIFLLSLIIFKDGGIVLIDRVICLASDVILVNV
jgi:hypothetical protein